MIRDLVMGAMMTEDKVNHPDHYGGDSIYETIKVLEAWLTYDQFIGFLRGNAIKYLSRADKKKGDSSIDKAKAEFYVKYELDFVKRHESGNIGETRAHTIALSTANFGCVRDEYERRKKS